MTYIKAVQAAVIAAKKEKTPMSVFGVKRRWWFGYTYYYGDTEMVEAYTTFINGIRPATLFLTVMSNGKAVQ